MPLVEVKRLFKLFAASPLIPADEMPTLAPNETLDWANEIVERMIDKISKICFFMLRLEPDLKAVPYNEKRKCLKRLIHIW